MSSHEVIPTFLVFAILYNQIIVITFFQNNTIIQQHDLVRVADGGEAVSNRNDSHGVFLQILTEAVLNLGFGGLIEGGGGFVEEENLLLAQEGASESDTLLLATGEVAAGVTNFSVVLLVHVHDVVVDRGELGVLLDFFIGGDRVGVTDVIADGAGEERGFLENAGEVLTPGLEVDALQFLAVDEDAAFLGVVRAEEELNESRFATAGRAHQTKSAARRNFGRETFQDGSFGASGVDEVNVFELDVAVGDVLVTFVADVDVGLAVDESEDALRSDGGVSELGGPTASFTSTDGTHQDGHGRNDDVEEGEFTRSDELATVPKSEREDTIEGELRHAEDGTGADGEADARSFVVFERLGVHFDLALVDVEGGDGADVVERFGDDGGGLFTSLRAEAGNHHLLNGAGDDHDGNARESDESELPRVVETDSEASSEVAQDLNFGTDGGTPKLMDGFAITREELLERTRITSGHIKEFHVLTEDSGESLLTENNGERFAGISVETLEEPTDESARSDDEEHASPKSDLITIVATDDFKNLGEDDGVEGIDATRKERTEETEIDGPLDGHEAVDTAHGGVDFFEFLVEFFLEGILLFFLQLFFGDEFFRIERLLLHAFFMFLLESFSILFDGSHGLGLTRGHGGEGTTLVHEFVEGAGFSDLGTFNTIVFDEVNLVDVADSSEAVSDDEDGELLAVLGAHQLIDSLLDFDFGLTIESRSSFIKNEDTRFADESASDSEALFLTTGELRGG